MALTLDYMSSEDSAEAEEGDGGKRAIFKVHELPWERKELREAKRSLDSNYLSNLSRRALYKRYKRVRGCQIWGRSRPIDSLKWAVRSKDRLGSPCSK
jgi:hypothetical protein